MKKLLLIRHAKSSWSDPTVSDFLRKLNKRGKRDAPFMAKKLAERGVKPDIFLSSPAKRARKTAKTVAQAIGYQAKSIVYNEDLYLASTSALYAIVQNLDETISTAFLVGHNYGLTDFAEDLLLKQLINVPTTGIVAMDCEIERWAELKPGCCSLWFFDFPKRYPELQ